MNSKTVIKRDGYIANYDRKKIENAIYPAFLSNNIPINEKVKFDIDCIIDDIEDLIDRPIGIEVIQNTIIDSLKEYGYYKVAQKYETYRISKDELREDRNEIYQKVFEVIDLKDKATLKENSNKDTKNVAVQRDVIAGITVKNFYLKYFVRPDVRIAFEENLIHLHDLDNALNKTNCNIFDYETVMDGGFNLGATRIREPQSINAGFSVLAEIIINGSGLQYGGFSCSELDKGLEKYLKRSFKKHYKNGLKYINKFKDYEIDEIINQIEFSGELCNDNIEAKKYPSVFNYAKELHIEELRQAVEAFETKINTLTTPNGQTAFSTISFGLSTTYEGREITKAILNQRLNGLDGKTAVFPKLVFLHKKGINANKDDKNYDLKVLSIKCAMKRVYPDILNQDIGTLKEHYDNGTPITPMGNDN